MAKVEQFKSPVGDLKWVVFSGEGKENMSGRMKYQADLVLPTDSDDAKNLIAKINGYWEENRPKDLPKGKPPKSLGYKPETSPVLDADGAKQYGDDGKVITELTGNTVFTFSTDVAYPSGDPKVVNIFNSKGNKVALGSKKIGNGSRGQISGAMGMYEVKAPGKGSNLADAGVTLYLNSIRLVKLVEFSGEENWDDVGEDDGWTGDEEWTGEGQAEGEGQAKPTDGTPRL